MLNHINKKILYTKKTEYFPHRMHKNYLEFQIYNGW